MLKKTEDHTCLEKSFFPIIGVAMVLVIIFEFILVGIYSGEYQLGDGTQADTYCEEFAEAPLIAGIALTIGMCFNMVWVFSRQTELGRVSLLIWVASTIIGIAAAGGALFQTRFLEDVPVQDAKVCSDDGDNSYDFLHIIAILFLVLTISLPHFKIRALALGSAKNKTVKNIAGLDPQVKKDSVEESPLISGKHRVESNLDF